MHPILLHIVVCIKMRLSENDTLSSFHFISILLLPSYAPFVCSSHWSAVYALQFIRSIYRDKNINYEYL
jgi:hypothetical protein